MAGHNKWSKIKRQKAVTDARRSKAWARLTREIMVAAREGGGDPAMYAPLALAVDRAKAENMPKDNIERAIKRGTGEVEGDDYVEMSYEGYAPGGIAVFIEALTDNTNRTVADLRHLFSKAGGSLGQTGSVAFQFDRKGVFVIDASGVDEAELFDVVAESGAEDLSREEDEFIVTSSVDDFGNLQQALAKAGYKTSDATLQRIPTTTVSVDSETGRKVMRLVDRIEELQDVQAVFTTLEFDENLITQE